MKSMLHEASTVAKAIEKAWTESGKPLEFTIKIHEVGEKNFFGMTYIRVKSCEKSFARTSEA